MSKIRWEPLVELPGCLAQAEWLQHSALLPRREPARNCFDIKTG